MFKKEGDKTAARLGGAQENIVAVNQPTKTPGDLVNERAMQVIDQAVESMCDFVVSNAKLNAELGIKRFTIPVYHPIMTNSSLPEGLMVFFTKRMESLGFSITIGPIPQNLNGWISVNVSAEKKD